MLHQRIPLQNRALLRNVECILVVSPSEFAQKLSFDVGVFCRRDSLFCTAAFKRCLKIPPCALLPPENPLTLGIFTEKSMNVFPLSHIHCRNVIARAQSLWNGLLCPGRFSQLGCALIASAVFSGQGFSVPEKEGERHWAWRRNWHVPSLPGKPARPAEAMLSLHTNGSAFRISSLVRASHSS